MALQSSGPIRFSEIAAEFGDTPPYSLSEYYREAGKVPGNNTNVPTSGALRLGQFFNAVNEIVYTATSTASLNLSSIFGSNWGTAVPKRLVVPSGVVLGPVTIPTGMSGTLTVQNAGEIQGLGGAANGGAGGAAIAAYSSFTLINAGTGAVRGGGGGGGQGGAGGAGGAGGLGQVLTFAGSNTCQCPCSTSSCPAGSSKTCQSNCGGSGSGCNFRACSAVYSYTGGGAGGAGGVGGAGGRGQGYGQTLATGSAGSSGSAGSAGGTNAGAGGTGGSSGTGGTGGSWATSGASGSTGNNGGAGANGNASVGSAGLAGVAGSTGGAAGAAVLMLSGTATVVNSGTINGAY